MRGKRVFPIIRGHLMNVTHKTLASLGACGPGIEDFMQVYPDGIDTTKIDWREFVMSDFRIYLDWLGAKSIMPPNALMGTDFSGCDLSGARFGGVNLKGCNFTRTILDRVNFSTVDKIGFVNQFDGCDFRGASLNFAFFLDARLINNSFVGADLIRTCFYFCDICGADFRETNLSSADIKAVKFDEGTKFPNRFNKNML